AGQAVAPADHLHGVAVAGGSAVAQLDAGDHQQEAEVLDLAVAVARLRAEVGAGKLEPDDVVGVVDDAHLVGLGVADLDVRDLAYRFAHGSPGGLPRRSAGRSGMDPWRTTAWRTTVTMI